MSDTTQDSILDAAAPVSPAASLPDHLEASHLRFINMEHIIGTVMSGLIPAMVIWMARTPLPMPVFGLDSLATSLIPATLLPSSGVPVVLTLVVRYRVHTGNAPALGWPLRSPGLARFVPGPILLRGLLASVLALLILPPIGLFLLHLFGVTKLSGTEFILYNFAHGSAIGALLLRPVVTRALADGGRAKMRSSSWFSTAAR